MTTAHRVTGLKVYGDSYPFGYWATPLASTLFNGFAMRLARSFGIPIHNYAVGGSKVYDALCAAYSTVALHHSEALIWDSGVNNLRAWQVAPVPAIGGWAASKERTMQKICCALRTFLTYAFADQIIPANCMKRTGFTSLVYGGGHILSPLLGGTGRAGVNGETLSFTMAGSRFAVCYFTSDGVVRHSGRFDISIDGRFAGQIDGDGFNDYATAAEALMPNARRFDVDSGLHEIIITATDATNSSYIDYIASLREPCDCAPVLICGAPYISPLGYPGFSVPPTPSLSDADMDEMNKRLRDVVSEFADFPVAFVDVNSGLNRDVDFSNGSLPSVDYYHRSDFGHERIFNIARIELGKMMRHLTP